ncbi:N-acetyl-gamma-glutamyl-phosphate reductase [Thermoleophilia bacterium SCSIO 60948]|nr:N-acetyl-gamma-glutamyl-phosphate reductase [Thermoleophilia bacterium SCSIO 60948]
MLVAGAAGLAGSLAADLVWRHPRLELVAATARADAGERLDRLHPRRRAAIELEQLDVDRHAGRCDLALVSYPHGAAAEAVAELSDRGLRVVDLSADFRLADRGVYERWYGEHGAPGLFGSAAYGLPELGLREEIASSRLVANPGCYPTASLLALAPLAEAGLIESLVIDAKSGVSGAGRGGGERLSFVSVTENMTPYSVGGHRHEPEIAERLGALGYPGELSFTPHLLPIDQGLMASCYVDLAEPLGQDDLSSLYADRYAAERFVELVAAPPGVRDVRESNLCRVHVVSALGGRRAIAFAAIDNLWKGAASQAIQNVNLMLGLDEGAGIS